MTKINDYTIDKKGTYQCIGCNTYFDEYLKIKKKKICPFCYSNKIINIKLNPKYIDLETHYPYKLDYQKIIRYTNKNFLNKKLFRNSSLSIKTLKIFLTVLIISTIIGIPFLIVLYIVKKKQIKINYRELVNYILLISFGFFFSVGIQLYIMKNELSTLFVIIGICSLFILLLKSK